MDYEQPQRIKWANMLAKKQPNDGVGRIINANLNSGEYPDSEMQQEFTQEQTIPKNKSGSLGGFLKGLFTTGPRDQSESQLAAVGIRRTPKIATILQTLGNGIGQIQMGAKGDFKAADRYSAKQNQLIDDQNGMNNMKLQLMKLMNNSPAGVREYQYIQGLPPEERQSYLDFLKSKKVSPLDDIVGQILQGQMQGIGGKLPSAMPKTMPRQTPNQEFDPKSYLKNKFGGSI